MDRVLILKVSEALLPLSSAVRLRPHRQSRFWLELRPYRRLIAVIFLGCFASCTAPQKQIGIPSEAQAAIDAATEDMAAEQDEKIYREADDEWRKVSTLEETKEFFKTLRTKLGKVRSRVFHSARGEQNASGVTPGQSFVVQYQTSFERADGMETFTLVQRGGRWLLARYFVSSEALKQ